mmetsp:Transcript_9696/g.16318  ORF Transcript_9696/g.16318 Transcript_9696/m.16318 type:complete len:106 (+) Transcript_9696:106-423(+)
MKVKKGGDACADSQSEEPQSDNSSDNGMLKNFDKLKLESSENVSEKCEEETEDFVKELDKVDDQIPVEEPHMKKRNSIQVCANILMGPMIHSKLESTNSGQIKMV